MKKLYFGIAATFLMGSALAVPVVLELDTDMFGNETSFSLALTLDGVGIAFDSYTSPTDGANGLLADGFVGFGDLASFTSYTFNWDLGAGDYEFTIFDDFGDGIFGDGTGYTLFVDGVEIVTGGEFGVQETTAFTIASVPEPGTLLLFGLGLAGLAFSRRRRIA